jgi:molybdopterin molybdotransferase
MINYKDAINTILKNIPDNLSIKKLSLFKTLGYALAMDIYSKEDIPTFRISKVNGYAVRSEDLKNCSENNPKELKLIRYEKIEDLFKIKINENEAVKVHTGYYVPEGANAVVAMESLKEKENHIIVFKSVKFGENIKEKGEEIKKNQLIAKTGEILTPPLISMIAKVGYASIRVYRKPKIYLIIAGEELITPGKELEIGLVWDPISYPLFTALRLDGFPQVKWFRVRGNVVKFRDVIDDGLRYSDFLIVCGSVFAEDKDYTKHFLENIDVKRVIWGINVKPAESLYFGTYDNKFVFVLPDDPFSALICYYEFVRPALLKASGFKEIFLKEIETKITTDLEGEAGIAELLLGRLFFDNEYYVEVKRDYALSDFLYSNCIVINDKGKINKGEKVKVHVLPWY